MPFHTVTIHANGANLAALQQDAASQLTTYLAPIESAREIAELLIGRTDIEAEAAARTIDGTITHYTADVVVRFTVNDLTQMIR
jgi:hypothetical protein